MSVARLREHPVQTVHCAAAIHASRVCTAAERLLRVLHAFFGIKLCWTPKDALQHAPMLIRFSGHSMRVC